MKIKSSANAISKNFQNPSKKLRSKIENKKNRIKNANIINIDKPQNILFGKKINSYHLPKKKLEEESLTLHNMDDEKIISSPKNNENSTHKHKKNTNIEKITPLYKKHSTQTSKNEIEYNLALAYNENHILDQLKRNSTSPLSDINNLNSLYNQKIILDSMKKKQFNENNNETNNENISENNIKNNSKNNDSKNNYNFDSYQNYFYYYNFYDNNYISYDNTTKTEDLNDDDLNNRYTSSYRNRMINILKVMPSKEICDDSLSELQNESRSSKNKLNQYYAHQKNSNKLIKRKNRKNTLIKNNKLNYKNNKKDNYPNLILKNINDKRNRNIKNKISITESGNNLNQNDISLTIKNLTIPSSKIKPKYQNVLTQPNESSKNILKAKKIDHINYIKPYNEKKSIKKNNTNKINKNLFSSRYHFMSSLIFLNKTSDSCEKFDKKRKSNINKFLLKANSIEKINKKSKYKNIFKSNNNDYLATRYFPNHQKKNTSITVFNESNKYFSPVRAKRFNETNVLFSNSKEKKSKNIYSTYSSNFKKKNEKKIRKSIFNDTKKNNTITHIKSNTGLDHIKSQNSENTEIRKYITTEKINISKEKNKKKIINKKNSNSLSKNKEKRKLEIKFIRTVVPSRKETNYFPDKSNITFLNMSNKYDSRNKINYSKIFSNKNNYFSPKTIKKDNKTVTNQKNSCSIKKRSRVNKNKYTIDVYLKRRLINKDCMNYTISNLIGLNRCIASSKIKIVVDSNRTRSNKKNKK